MEEFQLGVVTSKAIKVVEAVDQNVEQDQVDQFGTKEAFTN